MGHRSTATMLTLAERSFYWACMKLDTDTFNNTCTDCVDHMNRNAHQEYFPYQEASYPFEKISMDLGQTYAGEEILVICDRYSNYTWTRKTGTAGKGTSKDIQNVLTGTIGQKGDLRRSNEFSINRYEGILQKNWNWTNTVRRLPPDRQPASRRNNTPSKKGTHGEDLQPRNHGYPGIKHEPQKRTSTLPFESLHSLASPVSGIPMTPDR